MPDVGKVDWAPDYAVREDEPAVLVKRVCRWCGKTFKARRGEARRRAGAVLSASRRYCRGPRR